MKHFWGQFVFFVPLNFIVDAGYFLVDVYILELLPELDELRPQPIHELAKGILNPFLIF